MLKVGLAQAIFSASLFIAQFFSSSHWSDLSFPIGNFIFVYLFIFSDPHSGYLRNYLFGLITTTLNYCFLEMDSRLM